MIVYDCEIKKAISKKGEPLVPGIQYCEGWRDFKRMGVSCICAYDFITDRYRVFVKDNMVEFQKLIDNTDFVVGFNNHNFDDKLCQANEITIPHEKSYDILVEVWAACGLSPTFNFRTHGGYGLEALSKANFNTEKSGNGALAPIWWQQKKPGAVIDYCLMDVKLTTDIMVQIYKTGKLTCPKTGNELSIRKPTEKGV